MTVFLNNDLRKMCLVYAARTKQKAEKYVREGCELTAIDVDCSPKWVGFIQTHESERDENKGYVIAVVYNKTNGRPVRAFKTLEKAMQEAEFRSSLLKDDYGVLMGRIEL